MAKKRVLVLFGPNILREVEKDTVGAETYDSLVLHMKAHASELNICCDIVKSKWEGELIDNIIVPPSCTTELSLILEHLPTTVMPFGTPFNVCVFLLLKRIWKIYLLWKISVTNLLLPLYVRDKSVVWEQKAICWHWKLWQE